MLIKTIPLLLIILFNPLLHAQDKLAFEVSYFEDESTTLTVAQVQEKQFTPSHTEVQNHGITNTPHWFKLKINPTKEHLHNSWWLKIDYPPLDYIDYYLFDRHENLLASVHSGELRPFSQREISDPAFLYQLPLSDAFEHTLYIRVQTEGALQVPIKLMNSQDIIEEQYSHILIAGIYYGLFIIIAMFSAVIFIYTKEKNYLYYLLFISTFVFWQLSLDGIGVAYIWGAFPWLVEHASILGTSIVTFSAVLFARNFLQTSKHLPLMDIYLKYFMYFCFLLTLSATFAPYHYVVKVDGLLSIIAPVLLFITGTLVYQKGYQPARFYMAGWLAFLIGCILFSLNKFDLIGGFYVMNHAQQIGSAIEMIMLSLALGDRVKSIQDTYLKRANNLNQVLKRRLEKGLEKARQKDKIMIQQSRFAALGEMIEQIAHQWRQPLNTLGLINQNLYFKFKLQEFDPKSFDEAHEKIDETLQYMSQTIDDFRSFYKNNAQPETYPVREVIDSSISLSEAMLNYTKIKVKIKIEQEENCFVHNIKNELLQVCMNILKNAHDALIKKRHENRRINITIHPQGKDICLRFEDNAGGIDDNIISKIFDPYFTTKKDSHGTGVGLYMSKSIIEDHLNGEIKVENTDEGASFIIALPQADKLAIEDRAKVDACL